jgi:hypothetical protein
LFEDGFRSPASFALTPNQLAAANPMDTVHQDPRAANLDGQLGRENYDSIAVTGGCRIGF